jgi:hypothetical protein
VGRLAASIVLLTAGCHGGPGWLDGAGFEVGDAIFERKAVFADAEPVTMILVSDADDLCERISSGDSLAGYAELSIKSWESGSVQIELRNYDDDCEIVARERGSQGWVDAAGGDPYREDFDVVFRTEARSVSGRLAADFCPLPDSARIGCE